MRLSQRPADAAILSAILFPFLTAAVGNLQCEHARADETSWDFSELGGPRSVLHSVDNGASWTNTTYTIDICQALKRKTKSKKPISEDEECKSGTRLCSIERVINKNDGSDTLMSVFAVAGDLKDHGGGYLDAKWSRLKTSKLGYDAGKEGARLEIHGGFKTVDDGKKKNQMAYIEFLCDKDRLGDENLWQPEEQDQYDDGKSKREEKDDGAVEADPNSPSLEFLSYETSGDEDVLNLRWRTRFACEDAKEEKDAERRSHWGFFTWFIIIAFLSTATYLIFGSWLNYNRYGARGWDLLPHGDTIRDVPYLLKDWMRRVLNTVQGPGTRGGYAAV